MSEQYENNNKIDINPNLGESFESKLSQDLDSINSKIKSIERIYGVEIEKIHIYGFESPNWDDVEGIEKIEHLEDMQNLLDDDAKDKFEFQNRYILMQMGELELQENGKYKLNIAVNKKNVFVIEGSNIIEKPVWEVYSEGNILASSILHELNHAEEKLFTQLILKREGFEDFSSDKRFSNPEEGIFDNNFIPFLYWMYSFFSEGMAMLNEKGNVIDGITYPYRAKGFIT